jgi:hypothetical protein
MKLSILALFSAAVVGQGINAHAEATFGEKLMSRFTGSAVYEAKTSEIGPVVLLSEVEESQTATDSAATGVVPVSSCADPCCDTGCDSWFGRSVAPGTGAFGGDSAFAASLGFNQDTFFGNYTTLFAGYAINDFVDVTFYSILWHRNGLGFGTAIEDANGVDANVQGGFGLWTEFGGGLNFKAMDGALNINPQIGILNGGLLSGFNQANVFDGVVPNLTMSYADDFLESEFYMGYYVGTRGPNQSDFLHWWYNFGVKPWGDSDDWKSIISTGVHYEMLRQTENTAVAAFDANNVYSWVGPYFQVAMPNGLGMRYSAGWNVDNKAAVGDNFYKVNLTYDF